MSPAALVEHAGAKLNKLCARVSISPLPPLQRARFSLRQHLHQATQPRAFRGRYAASLYQHQQSPKAVSPGLKRCKDQWPHALRCRAVHNSSDFPTAFPVNKLYGGTVMTDQLYSYLLAHTREHQVHVSKHASFPSHTLPARAAFPSQTDCIVH